MSTLSDGAETSPDWVACDGDVTGNRIAPTTLTSNDLFLVIGMLDQVDGDLTSGRIGVARTRIRCLQSSLLKTADRLRIEEEYSAAGDRAAGDDAV